MEFHDAANIFPIDDEHIGELADDIRKNGLIVPIEMLDGKVLDGRRRWIACGIAQVKPRTVEVNPPDPIQYVVSLNLKRRHLTQSQLSMVGARVRELYDEQAKERMKAGQQSGGRGHKKTNSMESLPQSSARDAAGKAVGVSGRYVDFASKVLKDGVPELAKSVDDSRMNVVTAAIVAAEPPERQREILAEGIPGSKGRTYNKTPRKEPEKEREEPPEGESRGVGVQRANEAINCLKRIPKNDRLRKRGFQIVTDWIRHNK